VPSNPNEELMMRSKKSASKMAVALGAAKMQANDLQEKVGPAVADARHRVAPVVSDARERLTPVVDDARVRLTPVVSDARERLTPVVDDARVKLADLAESVATRLEESQPPKGRSKKGSKKAGRASGKGVGGKLRKLLLLAGLAGLAAVAAKKLRGSSEPQWQSTAPGRPVPPPASTTPPEPAGSVSGLVAAEDTAPDPLANDVAGGGSPDEAAADATEGPHAPTTPDNPTEQIDIDRR
jgi:hypothetical protein